MNGKILLLILLFALPGVWGENILSIPRLVKAPVVDGRLDEGEWADAAAVTWFGMVSGYRQIRRSMIQEQPVFYLGWDDRYFYAAMDCRENGANEVVGRITRNDFRSIVEDDCLELMLAPGTGSQIRDPDFSTYYWVLNHLGTMWDARLKPQRNECHNSYSSQAQTAGSTAGSRWIQEIRIPLSSVSIGKVADGVRWRMNLCRNFHRYNWVALSPDGALNDARVGTDCRFTERRPVVRLLSCESFVAGFAELELELRNPGKHQAVLEVQFALDGGDREEEMISLYSGSETVCLQPGETRRIRTGARTSLKKQNRGRLTVTCGKEVLMQITRNVNLPVPRLVRRLVPETPPVDVNLIFYPRKELLFLDFNAGRYLRKLFLEKADFSALITITDSKGKVWKKARFEDFDDGTGRWQCSTAGLSDGHYDVTAEVFIGKRSMMTGKDWFEKKKFSWMEKKILPDRVPQPFTPVVASGRNFSVWGRTFAFSEAGIPEQFFTQKFRCFSRPGLMHLIRKGRRIPLQIVQPMAFKVSAGGREALGKAVLAGGGIRLEIAVRGEYDGFVLVHWTLMPEKGTVSLEGFSLELNLSPELGRFYSASGDPSGVSFMGRIVPEKPGRFFDSISDTRSVGTTPSFASLFWIGNHEICFCYAADNDRDWELDPEKPSLTADRLQDGGIRMILRLIDRPVKLSSARTMEFAFQTGPIRPMPAGWRGYMDLNPQMDKPITPFTRVQIGGGGFTLHGGSHFMHPGSTEEMQKLSVGRIEKLKAPWKGREVVGYHYWTYTLKGFPESRVFRSEWGISPEEWKTGGRFREEQYSQRLFGEDRGLYHYLPLGRTVPSYVDFLTAAYDACLKHSGIAGYYDDIGYPVSVFAPEFGLGYEKNGREHCSTGLWLYRKRMRSAMEVNAKYERLNLISDCQRVLAQYMPAYACAGVFAPCEAGFYNHFPEKDSYEFFGSLEQYAAMTPALQYGQIPAIGLAAPGKKGAKLWRDTKVMCMLCFMHDHTPGSFGKRDYSVVNRFCKARAVIRQWEPGVNFRGYWKDDGVFSAEQPEIRFSRYERPGEILLFAANTGSRKTETVLKADWRKIGWSAEKCLLTDPLNDRPVELSGEKIPVKIPRHQLAMIYLMKDAKK